MRHEMILSYEEINGEKYNMKNEGQLIRCDDCVHFKTNKIFGGAWCKGKRISPIDFCSKAVRKI